MGTVKLSIGFTEQLYLLKTFNLFVCVRMSAHMCVCVFLYVLCTCVTCMFCMCMRPRIEVGNHLPSLLYLIIGADSQSHPEITDMASLTS